MSAVASWSYTSKATHWPKVARLDWGGAVTFAAPRAFDCDYIAESVRMRDAQGVEFVSRQTLYTERADIKPGDMVLIGISTEADPASAGAAEVRAVTRFADTFERAVDDWKVVT